MARNLSILAGTIGFNSRAALYFEDEQAAGEILSSIHEEKQVRCAAILDKSRRVFAEYSKDPDDKVEKVVPMEYGVKFTDKGIEVMKPIILEGKTIGSIYLFSDMTEFDNKIFRLIVFSSGILVVTFIACFILAYRIQKFISKPILNLAKITQNISENTNYSIRVSSTGNDEIGSLYSGFNSMIEAIENREKELLSYKQNLEKNIEERTQELLIEINSRKLAELEIIKSLREKEILLREVHHRAKNNMQIISSLLWLQASKITEKKYAEKFQECSLRLQTMSIIHENLYDSEHLHDIDLNGLITKLIENLRVSYGTVSQIRFNIDIDKLQLDIEKNMFCGLIVHELVSNSLHHAFPEGGDGEISISIHLVDANFVNIRISDNGVGFKSGFDLENVKTVGLQLVVSLIREKLKGDIRLNGSKNSEIILSFPLDR
jgi:two-component sensor histidine kinase/HAMP domain-containing protein